MKRHHLALVVATVVVIGLTGPLAYAARDSGQASPAAAEPPARFRRSAGFEPDQRQLLAAVGLRPAVGPGRSANAHNELRFHLEAAGATTKGARSTSNLATLEGRRVLAGSVPQPRAARLLPGQLLAVAVDGRGDVVWSAGVNDPRIVRAEYAGPDGVLHGSVLQRSGDMTVAAPADAGIREVRLFQQIPRRTGMAFEQVGQVAL